MSEFLASYLKAQMLVAPLMAAFAIIIGLFNGGYGSVLLSIAIADGCVAAILAD
jgi:hypothetical protein